MTSSLFQPITPGGPAFPNRIAGAPLCQYLAPAGSASGWALFPSMNLALSGDGSKLCDVGTIDDYTAIVSTFSLATTGMVAYPGGALPYWGQVSADGHYCFVSLSNRGEVSVVDFATATEVARVPVGTFPQRERISRIATSAVGSLNPAAG